MARLGPLLLKGAGALLLAFVVLGVIATVVSVLLSIVATIVAALVTLAVVAVFVLAAVGLFSLLRDGDRDEGDLETDPEYGRDADPEERLRSQYVEGQLTDAEFERELDRLLEEDARRSDSLEGRTRSRESTTGADRTRLWDR